VSIEFRSKQNSEDIGTVVLFLSVMFALAIISINHCFDSSSKVAKIENRMMSPLPKLSWCSAALLAFPAGFNAFFNDRFAYREELVCLINYINYRTCSVSGSPGVAVGHHGWLFFLQSGDEETARHEPLFSKAELLSWARMLESRQAWLAARKIKFLFVIAPSKCSIYQEELPAAYKPLHLQSRLDQLVSYLKNNSKLNVVELKQPLIEAKKFARLYYQTDTHWNPLGAYLGYSKIAESLKNLLPQIRPCNFSEVYIDTFRFETGDLQNMMGLHGLIPERVPRAFAMRKSPWKICQIDSTGELEVIRSPNAPYATEIDDKSLPRAFCLRDSFMGAVEPFLSLHFGRIAYYWQQEFPCMIIEREKPDIVIEEMVERDLQWFTPHNPPAVDRAFDNGYLAHGHRVSKNKIAGINSSPALR
jgi:alginate O-acetyltransferase complex protein AlgJ